jgi:integrase/recombinase XerD
MAPAKALAAQTAKPAKAIKAARADKAAKTPSPLIDRFIDALWVEDGLAPLTLAAYRRDLTLLSLWLAAQPGAPELFVCTEALLLACATERHAQTRATTANRRLTVFKRFFRWALREHLVLADPTLRLSSARQPLRVPKTLSEAQVEALLAAPAVDKPLGLRDRAMLELMYASGLRVSELVLAKSVHLSLSDGVVRVLGKGARERLVPFGDEAHDWLQRWLQEGRPALLGQRTSDALFVTVRGAAMTRQMFWKLVKRYALLAGIQVPLTHVARERLRALHAAHHPRG